MTILRRIILGTARTRRPVLAVSQILNPPPRACSRDFPSHRSFEQRYCSSAPESCGGPEKGYLKYPAFWIRFFGLGGSEAASSEAGEAASKKGLPADAPPNNLEDIVKKDLHDLHYLNLEGIFCKHRQEIEDLVKSKGLRLGTYPKFVIPVKGQGVTFMMNVEFMDDESLSIEEPNYAVPLHLSGANFGEDPTNFQEAEEGTAKASSMEELISSLENMGVRVYGLDKKNVISASKDISWDNLAGYDLQKRLIEETILLALLSPETYDDIARGTCRKFESIRPRAVLFEGPPGTGKLSSARVIANQVGVPLLYVPLEIIMSKWFGERKITREGVFTC